MLNTPTWLPEILNLSGDWEKDILPLLYKIFADDFIRTKSCYLDYQILPSGTKTDGKYEDCFWHLISRDDYQINARIPDFRRAERLPWCGPSISHVPDPVLTVWDYMEGKGKKRTYIWLENLDYVVILEKREKNNRKSAFIVTSYHVDGSSTRRKLKNKYINREP